MTTFAFPKTFTHIFKASAQHYCECGYSMASSRFNRDVQDRTTQEELMQSADPQNPEQQELVQEMKAHLKKLQEMRRTEDPRLSFSTPEFKDAQRVFTDNFKKNFGRPVEWALVKEYPWSTPQLRKLDTPVDMQGQPWKGN